MKKISLLGLVMLSQLSIAANIISARDLFSNPRVQTTPKTQQILEGTYSLEYRADAQGEVYFTNSNGNGFSLTQAQNSIGYVLLEEFKYQNYPNQYKPIKYLSQPNVASSIQGAESLKKFVYAGGATRATFRKSQFYPFFGYDVILDNNRCFNLQTANGSVTLPPGKCS